MAAGSQQEQAKVHLPHQPVYVRFVHMCGQTLQGACHDGMKAATMAVARIHTGDICIPMSKMNAQETAIRPTDGQNGETLAASIRRQLETDIAEGRLEPGARLDEQDLAKRFGVSRTPVREALRLLGADGLAELRGRQGAAVRVITLPAVLEMFQVMGELEGLCARLAARRITPGQRQRIADAHEALKISANRGADAFYDANQAFHEAIYDASANTFLAEQTRLLRNRVAPYRRRVTAMPTRIADTLREHEAVMIAIFDHDPEAAHRAMRAHLSLLGDDLTDFIAGFDARVGIPIA
jgi:DNA-binding GntR family transcriptional regulator